MRVVEKYLLRIAYVLAGFHNASELVRVTILKVPYAKTFVHSLCVSA